MYAGGVRAVKVASLPASLRYRFASPTRVTARTASGGSRCPKKKSFWRCVMSNSLCGENSCPRICVRVCHCPAGLARSRTLLGMQRNRREMSRARASPHPVLSRAREYDDEFTPEALHNPGTLNYPGHSGPIRHFPTHDWKQANSYGQKGLGTFSSTASFIWLLLFMSIVVLIGITLNGGNFIQGYTPPETFYFFEH